MTHGRNSAKDGFEEAGIDGRGGGLIIDPGPVISGKLG